MKKLFLFMVVLILVFGIVYAADEKTAARDVKKPTVTSTNIKPAVIAPSKSVSECMQELLKKQPNLLKNKAQSICNYRAHQKLTVANRAQAVKTVDVSKYTDLHKGKLESLVDKCKTEECKEKLRERVQKVETLTTTAQQRLQNLEQIKLKKLQDVSSLKQKPKFLKYSDKKEFKARVVAKAKLATAKTNFLRAKENFVKATKNYKEAKLKFQEVKKKVKECEDDETDECTQSREEIITKAREQLAKSADKILENLNKLKSKVESSEHLDDEDASEILANIEERISAVEEIKNKIDVAETKEDIKEIAKELRGLWSKMKTRLEEHAAKTVNARIGGIIVKSKQLEVKLERVLTRMTENGIDTTATQTLVDEFDALLEKSRSNYELAVDKFKEAKASASPNTELVREAQKYMKAAHSALKDAQKKLREIVLIIKEQGGTDELEETEDVEEEAEEEETEEEEEETEGGE